MIPEKIQSFRKILERNNLITVLCLLLVLVSFILNYLERRETLGKQLEFSYYVATDGEVIPARYAPVSYTHLDVYKRQDLHQRGIG